MQWDALFAVGIAIALFYIGTNPGIFMECATRTCEWWDLPCWEQAGEDYLCGKAQFALGGFALLGGIFALIMSVIGVLS